MRNGCRKDAASTETLLEQDQGDWRMTWAREGRRAEWGGAQKDKGQGTARVKFKNGEREAKKVITIRNYHRQCDV